MGNIRVQMTAQTVGDVRDWLAEVDRAGLPDDTKVHAGTVPALSTLGAKLRSLVAQGQRGGA